MKTIFRYSAILFVMLLMVLFMPILSMADNPPGQVSFFAYGRGGYPGYGMGTSADGTHMGVMFNPTGASDIWGLGFANDMRSIATPVLVWSSMTRVGIGIANPTSTLHVVGSATVTGTITSTFIGSGAGLTNATNAAYAAALSTAVYTTGTQSVGGQKTFTSPVQAQTASDPGPRFIAQHASLPSTYFTEIWDSGKIVQARNTWSAGTTGVWISSSATETWIDATSGGFDFQPRGVSAFKILGDKTVQVPGNSFSVGGSTFACQYGKCGIGDTSPEGTIGLTINQGAADDIILSLKSSDLNHGLTVVAESDTYGFIKKNNPTRAGLWMGGISSANGDGTAINLVGYVSTGTISAATPSGRYIGYKMDASQTTTAALGDADTLFSFQNAGTAKLDILGNGNVGIVNTNPQNKLSVAGDVSIGAIDIAAAANLFVTSSKSPSAYVVKVSSADGTNQLVSLGNGNVGIGNVVPSEALEVIGGIGHYPRTMAQLLAIAPSQVGVSYFCSDCSPAKLVVSTGTSAGNFADAVGGAFQ